MSMNLRQWKTNCVSVMNTFPAEKVAQQEGVKVLGLYWNSQNDTLSYKNFNIHEPKVVTKRHILQVIAQFFDPLGFFSPCLLLAKILLQKLWCEKLGWDDKVAITVDVKWRILLRDLHQMSLFEFPRRVIDMKSMSDAKIVCFCDASDSAFAACVYMVYQDGGVWKSSILIAKARLAPKNKRLTIPRLELLAVNIGTRLAKLH